MILALFSFFVLSALACLGGALSTDSEMLRACLALGAGLNLVLVVTIWRSAISMEESR